MANFKIARDRDAYFVIRGFVYQVDLTILKWIGLKEGERLLLEAGEDVDLVAGALQEGEQAVSRVLGQVKHRENNITLRTDEAKIAVANAHEHRCTNPELALVLQFITNAEAGYERPNAFEKRLRGIAVWEEIREGKVEEQKLEAMVSAVFSYLKSEDCPAKLNVVTWKRFKDFLDEAISPELISLVKGVQWLTGRPDLEDLSSEIESVLIEREFCIAEQASDLHARLFMLVIRLLSRQGLKELTREELKRAAEREELDGRDKGLLQFIKSEVLVLRGEMSDLKGETAAIEKRLSTVEREITHTLTEGKAIPNWSHPLPAIPLELPPLVTSLCGRDDTVAGLVNDFHDHTWLALYGGIGTGKTHLAVLIAQTLGENHLAVSLRGLSPRQAAIQIGSVMIQLSSGNHMGAGEAISNGIGALNPGAILLLEDLVWENAGGALTTTLLAVVDAAMRNGIRLISTSYNEVATDVRDRLPPGILVQRGVPPFTEGETLSLLGIHGAPEQFSSMENAQKLWAVCKGHPTLLVACARKLSSMNWPVDMSIFQGLAGRLQPEELIDNTVKRLLETVSDCRTRQFLYRLSLIIGHFGRSESETVAKVAPAIDRLRERTVGLAGIWLERHRDGTFTVCPLVIPLGLTELGNNVRRTVLCALAELLLSSSEIDISDLCKIIRYLTVAEEHQRLAGVLVLALLSARAEMPPEQLRLLFDLSWGRTTLPGEIAVETQLMLRAQHLHVAEKLEIGSEYLLEEVDHLFSISEPDDALGILAAALSAIQTAHGTNFERTVGYISHLRNLIRNPVAYELCQIRPPGDIFIGLFPLKEICWLAFSDIRTPVDVSIWLDFLDGFTEPEMSELFSSRDGEIGTLFIVDRLWEIQRETQVPMRDWPATLASYDRICAFSQERHVSLLWATAVHAKLVVLLKYLGQADEAVRIGNAALANGLVTPREELLIAGTFGRLQFHHGDAEIGVRYLERAVTVETESFPHVRLRTFLELSRAVGKNDPERAVELGMSAVRVARENPVWVPELELLVALGELGIAEWLIGDWDALFNVWDEAIARLLEIRDVSGLWKQYCLQFGHATGYLAGDAIGKPPTHVANGELYVRPDHGWFLKSGEVLERVYEEGAMDEKIAAMLPAQMTLLANALGKDEEAAKWALRGMAAARDAGIVEILFVLGNTAGVALLLEGKVADAVDVVLESSCAGVASKLLLAAAAKELEPGQAPERILGPKPNAHWSGAENRAVCLGVVPAVMHIVRENLSDPSAAKQHLADLLQVCQDIEEYASDKELWSRTATIVARIFSAEADFQSLHSTANEWGRGGRDSLQVLGYLGASLLPSVDVNIALVSQAIALEYLTHFRGNSRSPTFVQIVLPFVNDWWRNVLSKRAFSFQSPRLVKERLDQAREVTDDKRVQAILQAVASGLEIVWPGPAENARSWVYS